MPGWRGYVSAATVTGQSPRPAVAVARAMTRGIMVGLPGGTFDDGPNRATPGPRMQTGPPRAPLRLQWTDGFPSRRAPRENGETRYRSGVVRRADRVPVEHDSAQSQREWQRYDRADHAGANQ